MQATITDTTTEIVALLEKANTEVKCFLKFKRHDPDMVWQSLSELQALTHRLRQLRPALKQGLNELRSYLALSLPELQAVHRAKVRGWLEVTSEVGDLALEYWQQECRRGNRAFALSRPEAKRTSSWLFLPEGWGWNQAQRDELARSSSPGVKGILFTENSARAFVPPGSEAEVFGGLLRAACAKQLLHMDRHPSFKGDDDTALRSDAATRAGEPLLLA